MARPACTRCKRPTIEKGYLERGKMCAPCFKFMQLEPYDDAVAEQRVRTLYREGGLFDRVLAAMRRTMQPPPGYQTWELPQVVELDSRRFTW